MTAPSKRGRRIAGWRLWLSLGVTVVALAWTVRDVDGRDLLRAMSGANPWIIAVILPLHILALWLRAARWRYLTDAIAPARLPSGALFRATAVGYLALNVLPLRIGEVVRPWFLARETGVRAPAALGTVVVERALDFMTVAAIGGFVLFFHTQTLPMWVQTGATLLAGLGLVPLLLALGFHMDEARATRWTTRALSVLPARTHERAMDLLLEVARGLRSFRGGRVGLLVLLQSFLLWGVLFPVTFALGLAAFELDLTPAEATLASYTALVFTALAVAAPAAPGFFGVYHFACREALALFKVPPAIAVGYGTVLHLAFWVPVTLVGLVVLARSGVSLGDLSSSPLGKAGSRHHR